MYMLTPPGYSRLFVYLWFYCHHSHNLLEHRVLVNKHIVKSDYVIACAPGMSTTRQSANLTLDNAMLSHMPILQEATYTLTEPAREFLICIFSTSSTLACGSRNLIGLE
jgi:hypothetical protein